MYMLSIFWRIWNFLYWIKCFYCRESIISCIELDNDLCAHYKAFINMDFKVVYIVFLRRAIKWIGSLLWSRGRTYCTYSKIKESVFYSFSDSAT
jgi:hypothetical protein